MLHHKVRRVADVLGVVLLLLAVLATWVRSG